MFVDTGAFFARYRDDDDDHAKAIAGWRKITLDRTQCWTTDLVVAETVTLLGRDFGGLIAAERARAIFASRIITVLRPDRADELLAIQLLEKYADQRIQFVDCVSIRDDAPAQAEESIRLRPAFSNRRL